ncbi:MAG TPA: hypothetical protein VGY76_02865 [Solirubrobacteraceae bacterium]|jgi:hypothetical protein|nr:hypothetical protein [Solirubrobacteraceae bacterium]
MLARSSHQPPNTATPEVSLLLRAHAEQRWLSREVVPVVRQLSTREALPEEQLPAASEALPEEQLPAALAYLEVIWIEAVQRAGDTDKALTCLDLSLPPPQAPDCLALATRARRYRAAVLVLREAVSQRVAELLAWPAEDYSAESAASNFSRR